MFKVLAHNDTGQAVGHQSGVLIPRELDPYFPQLIQAVTPQAPAPRVAVTAALFNGDQFLGEVETYYQYQTWGGTRSPERRLTSNLGPLLGLAHRDDLLLIERGLVDTSMYRLRLIRQGTAAYQRYRQAIGARRSGPLMVIDPPVSEPEVTEALVRQEQRELAPLDLFEEGAPVVETRSKRIARSRAFQKRLYELYNGDCAFCGSAFRRLDGKSEAEAAHIVPRGLKGADDARNGLLLCKAHHWAFDNGLIGIGADRKILVPAASLALAPNAALAALHGLDLRPSNDAALAPSDDALLWHREEVLVR